MFLKKASSPRGSRLLFVGLAFLIALLYDICVWDAQIGFGFLLWVVASLGLFTLFIFLRKQDRQQWAVLFTIPIIIMAIDTLMYQNSLVVYVVPTVIVILSLFYFAVYPAGNPHKERFLLRTVPMFRSIDLPFLQWSKMYKDLFRWREDARKDTVRRVLIGFVIATPIIIIFGWLFALADEVFKDWIINVLDIDWVDVWRLFRTLVITLFAGSIFYSVIRPEYVVSHKDVTPKQLDIIIVSIVLLLVNFLFGVFVFFQFKYLFGGSTALLESGLSHAAYARKGFFELCWVIGLAAVMLLIIYRSFVFHARSWIVTVLQTLLIAQVGVIAVSALTRMNLYQEAFGFTVLRLYVEWFLYFAIIILAFAGIALIARLSFRIFFYTTLVLGVVASALVSSINVESMIAKENVRRFVQDGVSIDFQYLQRLSPDSSSAYALLSEPEAFAAMSVAQQTEFIQLIDSMQKKIGERVSWKELHLGSIRAGENLRVVDMKLHGHFKESRKRKKQFESVEAVLNNKLYAQCHSFDEQPVRTLYPKSTFECAYKMVGNTQFVYVLEHPEILFDPSVAGNFENATPFPSTLTVIDLTNKTVRVTYDLPTVVRKIRVDERKGYYTYPPNREKYDGDMWYRAQNDYLLLTDGRIVERNRGAGTHHLRTITHDGGTLRIIGPSEIRSLSL